jgi:DNA-binding FadR family transcriptional regulator
MTLAIKEKKASQVTLTLNRLVSSITSGHYKGMLPPQDKLATELHVSRTVLREAIAMMIARNMIVVKSKVGTKINPQEQWLVLVSQSTLTEAREVVEMFVRGYNSQLYRDDIQRATAFIDTLTKAGV